MKDHEAVSRHASFRDLSDLDPTDFLPASDQDLWDAQDELIRQQPLLTKTQLEQLETACGQNCEPLGLMACQELRPYVKPTRSSFDSWHCYFVGGAAEVELDLLAKELYKCGFSPEKIQAFCNDRWVPAHSLKFTASGLKGMAGDVLRAVFLFKHMCLTVLQPAGLLLSKCTSFCALAEVVQCLQDMKLFEIVPDEAKARLCALQTEHAGKFKAAYGTAHVKPKHHFGMHIPRDLQGILVDTATCERKQRLIKSQIQRLPRCDASKNINIHITVNVNLCQLDESEHKPSLGSLIGKTSVIHTGCVQGESARTCMTSFGLTLAAGDVLFVEEVTHLLRACLKLHDGSLNFRVQRCDLIRLEGAGKLWSLLDDHLLLQEPDESHSCFLFL